MSELIIDGHAICKSYRDTAALTDVDLQIHSGSVLGLIGPNGAGKTTLLRSLLGMCDFAGDLQVFGKDPRRQRAELLEQVCTIADTAVLPRWMSVKQLLKYVSGVHPRFSLDRAQSFLGETDIRSGKKVGELSRGMVVQLHLALAMSIDASLLILDEPTLGLDILFRKQFFEQLLNDYYDEDKTIIISTHQVEEVEHILTEIMFLKSGSKLLHQTTDDLSKNYLELQVSGDNIPKAESLNWMSQRSTLGGKAFIFENVASTQLADLGEITTPSLADLFVAKIAQGEHP